MISIATNEIASQYRLKNSAYNKALPFDFNIKFHQIWK